MCACSEKTSLRPIDAKDLNEKIEFPDDWMGYWTCELHIYKNNKKQQSIPMAIDHEFTDIPGRYEWAIIYGEDTITGRRDYYLETVNAKNGKYRIDEQNGIYLDSYLNDNVMVSYFDVQGNTNMTSYTHQGETILFEVFASSTKVNSITGDTIIGIDTIPSVKNYPINAYQRAVLSKR